MSEQRTAVRARRSLVNLRVSADDRDLITRAAEALGKNRSEFMLDAARQAARDALLDRTLFRPDSAASMRSSRSLMLRPRRTRG